MFKSVDQIVEEGSRSYEKGIGKAFNPYSPFRPSHWSWLSGWLQARSYALEKKIKKLEDSISALKAREDILNRTIRDLSTTSALLQREVQSRVPVKKERDIGSLPFGPGNNGYPTARKAVKDKATGKYYVSNTSGPVRADYDGGPDGLDTFLMAQALSDLPSLTPTEPLFIPQMSIAEPPTCNDSGSSSWSSSSSCDSGYSSSCDSGYSGSCDSGGGSCGGGGD